MRKGLIYLVVLLFLPTGILVAKEGYLGVYPRDLSKAQKKAIGVDHGVFIKDIVEDSPADEAGIQPGDVILAINEEEIEDRDEFSDFIDKNPGELVELTILRDGKELKLKAQLGEKEERPWDEEGAVFDKVFGKTPPWESRVARIALLIPILAIVMTLLIPIMWFYFDYRKKAVRSRERIAAIEKGIELPPEPVAPRKVATPLDTLRRGFICLGIGVALIVFSIVAKEIEIWSMGGGLVLLFIGLALVIWYRIAIKKEGIHNP